MEFKKLIIFFLLSFSLTSHAIIGGVDVGEEEYLSVVQIGPKDMANCTGFFIKDNLLVTARHCLKNLKEDEKVYIYAFANKKLETPIASQTLILPDEQTVGDFALVVFEQGTAMDVLSLSTDEIKKGDKIEFVGYGNHRKLDPKEKDILSGETSLIKKKGEGLVDAVFEKKMTYKVHTFIEPKVSYPSKGDSGGPVLFNGKAIALISGYYGDNNEVIFQEFVLLTNPSIVDWIDAME